MSDIKVGDRFLVEMKVLGIDEGGSGSFSVSVSGHTLGVPRHVLGHELLAGTRLSAPDAPAPPADLGVTLETTPEERRERIGMSVERVGGYPGSFTTRLIRDHDTLTAALAREAEARREAEAEIGRLRKAHSSASGEPDYWYHPDDWEYTNGWDDLYMVDPEIGEVTEIATLYEGPRYFVVRVSEDTSPQAFRSEAEARAALATTKTGDASLSGNPNTEGM